MEMNLLIAYVGIAIMVGLCRCYQLCFVSWGELLVRRFCFHA